MKVPLEVTASRSFHATRALDTVVHGTLNADHKSFVELGAETPASVLEDLQIYPNFIPKEEHHSLVEELTPILEKKDYNHDHWDKLIVGYRELEKGNWVSRTCAL